MPLAVPPRCPSAALRLQTPQWYRASVVVDCRAARSPVGVVAAIIPPCILRVAWVCGSRLPSSRSTLALNPLLTWYSTGPATCVMARNIASHAGRGFAAVVLGSSSPLAIAPAARFVALPGLGPSHMAWAVASRNSCSVRPVALCIDALQTALMICVTVFAIAVGATPIII